MRACVVGVGSLGATIVECILTSGVKPEELLLVERSTEKALALRGRFPCPIVVTADEMARHPAPALVFLTVKPQDFLEACDKIRPLLPPPALVISCMAGVATSLLSRALNHSELIRAMPNLGAGMRQSATVFYAPPGLSGSGLQHGETALRLLGKVWQVEREELIDAATAVAGSGPAYICWLAEIMEQEARRLGFASDASRDLVLQTLRATVEYLGHSHLPFEELRQKVTSRGGTTAAALSVLADEDAAVTFRKAIQAAFERSIKLGTEINPARE